MLCHSEGLAFSDKRKRQGPNTVLQDGVWISHPAIPPCWTNVDRRREFDAPVAAPNGVVVCPPKVRLPTTRLEEELLAVGVEFAADRNHSAFDIRHVLDHVLEVHLDKSSQIA